jgi:hypothetical protein
MSQAVSLRREGSSAIDSSEYPLHASLRSKFGGYGNWPRVGIDRHRLKQRIAPQNGLVRSGTGAWTVPIRERDSLDAGRIVIRIWASELRVMSSERHCCDSRITRWVLRVGRFAALPRSP